MSSYLIPQLLSLVMSAGTAHIFDARSPWKVCLLYVCMAFQMALVYIGSYLNASMQRDVTQLKTDVAELKIDVAELKTDMRRLVHYLMPDEDLAMPTPCARSPACELDSERVQSVRRHVDEDDVEAVVDDVIDLMICDIEAREEKDARFCELIADTRATKHGRDAEIELEAGETLKESIADGSPLTRRKPVSIE
jgi:hypothetical protein